MLRFCLLLLLWLILWLQDNIRPSLLLLLPGGSLTCFWLFFWNGEVCLVQWCLFVGKMTLNSVWLHSGYLSTLTGADSMSRYRTDFQEIEVLQAAIRIYGNEHKLQKKLNIFLVLSKLEMGTLAVFIRS